MATSVPFNICPAEIDICISRGDTLAFSFAVKDSNLAVVDITGSSFILTVDPERNPIDAVNNLFALTGTITDGPNGVVQFEMSASQADQSPNVYHFDLQQTDATTRIRTIAKGRYEFRQDVTK